MRGEGEKRNSKSELILHFNISKVDKNRNLLEIKRGNKYL